MAAWGTIASRAGWLLVGLAAVYGYLRYFEWRNIYYPSRELLQDPAAYGLEYENIEFMSEDGRLLHGWWIPHPSARGTVIHCHGNAGNIGDRIWMAADLHRLGVNVFLFDYRGYGRSRGLPTEQGTYRDARAAYEVVRTRYADAENPPVVVHGQSLGGAVAIQLALDKPVRAVIVESTFSSVIDMGRMMYPGLPVRLFCHFRYESTNKVAGLRVPAIFAHSPTDDVVPFELGRRLFENAPEPKEFHRLAGGHNDSGWQTSAEYWQAISNLFDRVLGPVRQ